MMMMMTTMALGFAFVCFSPKSKIPIWDESKLYIWFQNIRPYGERNSSSRSSARSSSNIGISLTERDWERASKTFIYKIMWKSIDFSNFLPMRLLAISFLFAIYLCVCVGVCGCHWIYWSFLFDGFSVCCIHMAT